MLARYCRIFLIVGYVVSLLACTANAAPKMPIPPAAVDVALAATSAKQNAVFAGGCFWGTQAVFERVKGVLHTTVGYAGGSASTATYDQVTTETTGHAESVEVEYDPSKITYGQLLRIFFSVAHDPTQLNRQGPDVGSSYRSAIFYANAEQKTNCRRIHRSTGCCKDFPKANRYASNAAQRFLSGGRLPSGLRAASSRKSIYRGLRSSKDRSAAEAVSGIVCRLQRRAVIVHSVFRSLALLDLRDHHV